MTSSRWQLRDHVVSEGAHPSRHQHGSGTLYHCSTTFPTRTEPTVTMLRFLVSSEYHFRTTQTIEHLWGLQGSSMGRHAKHPTILLIEGSPNFSTAIGKPRDVSAVASAAAATCGQWRHCVDTFNRVPQ